jgi:hypothetical protein
LGFLVADGFDGGGACEQGDESAATAANATTTGGVAGTWHNLASIGSFRFELVAALNAQNNTGDPDIGPRICD